MISIYNYSTSTLLLIAVFLAFVLAGCKDNVVGVDGFCPIVDSTNPINLATDVSLGTVITVTFEERINPETMKPSAFKLTAGATTSAQSARNADSIPSKGDPSGTVPSSTTAEDIKADSEVTGTMTYDNASNTMSFTPDAPLSSNTVYTGRVIKTVEDPLGNKMLEDYVWSFTTEEVAAAPSPTVVSTMPQDGAVDVALNAIVNATFSQDMDAATLDQATFTLFNGTTQIEGSVSYTNLTASFVPASVLSAETTYTATITTGAENNAGTALENNFTWSFTTDEQGVIISPTVVSTMPQDGAEDVALNAIVNATFSQVMTPGSLNQTTFTLFNGSTQINGSVSYTNMTASFVPNSVLSAETTYTATITTGAENNMGIGLENNFVWSFTTDEDGVIASPTVVSTIPQTGAVDVALDTNVSATFSQVMTPGSLNQTTFTLFDGSTQVDGEVSYTNMTATFVPDSELSSETTYTATITTGAENDIGTSLEENYTWSFTTEEEEVMSPIVVSTDPEDNDENVELNVIVNATFSQDMAPASLNQATFTLFDGNNQIGGSVSYNNMTASFEPDSDLSPETTYTATITTGAENDMGTSLEEDYIWTFMTEEEQQLPPPVLGAADSYGIMATAAITNTGLTVINGDVALDPGTSLTGFPPGIINGDLNINNTESAEARADLLEAYNYFKGLPPGTTIPAGADLGALYPDGIAPGTYTSGSTMLVESPLVLDAGGDENAVWVFQIGSSLTTGADVTLTGGANENNVFWVSTDDATVGVGTTFNGTIVSGRDVTANTGATINGRILAGAITAGTIALDSNTVNVPGF